MTPGTFRLREKVLNTNADRGGRVCLTTLASISFLRKKRKKEQFRDSVPKTLNMSGGHNFVKHDNECFDLRREYFVSVMQELDVHFGGYVEIKPHE